MSAWTKQAVPLVFMRIAIGSLAETNGHIKAVKRARQVMDLSMAMAWHGLRRRNYPVSYERQQRIVSESALAMRDKLARLWASGVEHVTELPYGMLFVAEDVLRMMPQEKMPECARAWRLIACLCLALCKMTDADAIDVNGGKRGDQIRIIVMEEAA